MNIVREKKYYNSAYVNLNRLGLVNTLDLDRIKLAGMKESIYRKGELHSVKKGIVNSHLFDYKSIYIVDFIFSIPLLVLVYFPIFLLINYFLSFVLLDVSHYLSYFVTFLFLVSFSSFVPFSILKFNRIFYNKIEIEELH